MSDNIDSKNGYPTLQLAGSTNQKKHEFMSREEWELVRKRGDFDYVIIGSSFCALGFTHQLLKNKSSVKILIIDRGYYIDPDDIKSLPPQEMSTDTDKSKRYERIHWNVSKKTQDGKHIEHVRGMNDFFGGRSLFWKAWSPQPPKKEMAHWPDQVIDTVQEYFPKAKELLNVQPVNEIGSGENGKGEGVFEQLQTFLFERLESARSDIEAITRVEHAPLAVTVNRHGEYQKFSASRPLLDMFASKQIHVKINCLVKKILHENCRATSLETDQGDFVLGKAKLILAMGTLPPTTLMLNSFPSSSFGKLSSIGTRFTAHFVSKIMARVPSSSEMYASLAKQVLDKLDMAALYISGEDKKSKHQFHIQLSAIRTGETTQARNESMSYPLKNLIPKRELLTRTMSSSSVPPLVN